MEFLFLGSKYANQVLEWNADLSTQEGLRARASDETTSFILAKDVTPPKDPPAE